MRYGPQPGHTDKWGKPKRKYAQHVDTPQEIKALKKKFAEDQRKQNGGN